MHGVFPFLIDGFLNQERRGAIPWSNNGVHQGSGQDLLKLVVGVVWIVPGKTTTVTLTLQAEFETLTNPIVS